VQINGKLRDQIEAPADATKEQIIELAKASQKAASYLKDSEIKKEIYVPGKLVSFVI
jgi:leucyl-tRNA synthetase